MLPILAKLARDDMSALEKQRCFCKAGRAFGQRPGRPARQQVR